MDVIALRGIRARGKHGANPGEWDREQPFDVDLELQLDLSGAERSNDLSQTVNYADVHKRVIAVVTGRSYVLLEKLAGAILDEIFRDPRIAAASICVAKPELLDGATPSVTLHRKNSRYTGTWP